MAELTIIVPTYNESSNVGPLVSKLTKVLSNFSWEVIFVDDDAPDDTQGMVRNIAQPDHRVRLMRRSGGKGLTRTVVEGMLSTNAAFIAVMDADHPHDERILPVLLDIIAFAPEKLRIGEVLFCMVETSGVSVHLGTLWLAHREFGQDFMLSQTIATLVAMTSHYALNNEFTYQDRKRRGLDWLTGLLSFYAVCGLGVIANVGVAGSLFLREGWLIAAFAGTVVGVMGNYIASKSITWGSR